MESDPIECDFVVDCPACKKSFDSFFYVTSPINEMTWECPDTGCSGSRRLQFGNCVECQCFTVLPWKEGRTKFLCSCEALSAVNSIHQVYGRVDEIARKLDKLDVILENVERYNSRMTDLEKRHGEFVEGFKDIKQSLEKISRKNDSTNAAIAKAQGQLGEDLGINREQILREVSERLAKPDELLTGLRFEVQKLSSRSSDMSKVLGDSLGILTEKARQSLADLVCEKITTSLSLKLFGQKKAEESDKLIPAFPDMSSMVKEHLTRHLKAFVTKPLKILEHDLIAAVNAAVEETLASGKPRGKVERPVSVSPNLDSLTVFLEKTKKSAALAAMKSLPEIFNIVEFHLRPLRDKVKRSENDREGLVALELLQEIEDSLLNWQRRNNIDRFPKQLNEPVVLRLHEIVGKIRTEERELHRLIGRVDRHGYLLQDGDDELILQKAKVIVLDCSTRE